MVDIAAYPLHPRTRVLYWTRRCQFIATYRVFTYTMPSYERLRKNCVRTYVQRTTLVVQPIMKDAIADVDPADPDDVMASPQESR